MVLAPPPTRRPKARTGEHVRIRVSNPVMVPELVEFLGRASCVSGPTRGASLDVELPHARSSAQARRELRLYLAAWSGLHPNVDVRMLD